MTKYYSTTVGQSDCEEGKRWRRVKMDQYGRYEGQDEKGKRAIIIIELVQILAIHDP